MTTYYLEEDLLIKEIKYLKFILSITVLLDAINGFIAINITGWAEELIPFFRVLLIIFFMYLLYKIDNKKIALPIVTGIVWTIIIFIRLFLNDSLNFSGLLVDGTYVTRFFYFFMLFLLLINLSEYKFINKEWIIDVININARLMSILILIPAIMGIGRKTYEGSGFGNSGFFIANNSTNIVLITSSLFLLYRVLISNKRDSISILFLSSSIISLVIQGSKTSLLFVFLELLVLIVFLSKSNYKKILQSKRKTIVFLLGLIMLTVVFKNTFYEMFERFFDNIIKLYERQKYLANLNDGFFNILLSGRLTFFENILKLLPKESFLFLIFGVGTSNLPKGSVVEMDIIDIYIREGALGIIVTYGITIKYWYLIIKNMRYYNKVQYVSINVVISILIGYSILAGHVFVDIMPSSFVAFFLTLGVQYLKKEEDNNEITSFNSTISK